MERRSSTNYLSETFQALTVAILFYFSYFFIVNKFVGLIFVVVAVFLFIRAIYSKEYYKAFWIIIFLTLLQNILYALFSMILVKLIGEGHAVELMSSNKYWSYVMLEGKLIFVGIWCAWIFVCDFLQFAKNRTISSIRFFTFLLIFLLLLISLLTVSKFSFGIISNTRNYISLLSVLIIGSFLGTKYSNDLEKYFPSQILIPIVFFASVINLFTDIILRTSTTFWNDILGVKYLYFAKLFFNSTKPVAISAGRFTTEILGVNLPRSGGIYLEPVNYGYVLVFFVVICAYYYFKTKRNIDLIALLLSLFFLIINFGKGALLTGAVILVVYLIMKIFPARSWKIFTITIISILLIVLGMIFLAPLISASTAGHLNPFSQFIEYASRNMDELILGNGIGTSGNFIKNTEFFESAFVVMLSEVGVLWYIMYLIVMIALAFKVFVNKNIHPLLASFGVVGLFTVFVAGTFQENVFSLQIGIFTVLLGVMMSSKRSENKSLEK